MRGGAHFSLIGAQIKKVVKRKYYERRTHEMKYESL